MSDIQTQIEQIGRQAKQAAKGLREANTQQKNQALLAAAAVIAKQRAEILAANAEDLREAQAKGLEPALLDRLALNESRLDAMLENLRQVAALPDPVGQITDLQTQPSGIQVGRMRVSLGVIGIIYEARPNVTVEAASLCLKSGNAVILRGGSESLHSNLAIYRCLQQALAQAGLPEHAIQLIETRDRAAVGALIQLDRYVDVLVPRGGKSLIERISRDATVPVIKHLDGICHVYIDDKADHDKALRIALNAKTHRYGTCNTMETLLLAQSIAASLLPELVAQYRAKGVELRGCDQSRALIPDLLPATEADWSTEYLAPILSIRIVPDLNAAIDHINHYSSAHTDAIVTEDFSRARRFLNEVDSSSVMVNASTRFADGFEYGLGAEIGISTNKLHARGPVGLEGLTTLKYVVLGDGHIRQ